MTIDRSRFKATPVYQMILQSILMYDADNKFKYFSDYIFNMENYLKETQIEYDREMTSQRENIYDNDEMEMFIGHYEGVVEQYFKFNPSLLYNSTFISLYSYIEVTLVKLFKTVIKADNYDLEKCIALLKNYLPFKSLRTIEKTFKDYRVIRNTIIHSNAYILSPKNFAEVRKIADRLPSIELDESIRSYSFKDSYLLQKFNGEIKDFLMYVARHFDIDYLEKIKAV